MGLFRLNGRFLLQVLALFFVTSCALGASLSGGVSNQPGQSGSPGSADLTAAGLLDWVHWGRGSRTDVNRKASAAVSIGDYERLDPNGPRVNRMTDGRTAYRWSDGTPRGVESGTTTGLFFTADGYRIRVPADTSERTVSVYLGGWASSARFTASLSDGSAPSVVFDAGDGLSNASSVYDKVVTLTYSAASSGATLNLAYEILAGGNITLQAVTLHGSVGSVNAPPRFDSTPVGVATATVDYQYSIRASDPDAGDVLTVAAPSKPAWLSFEDNGAGTASLYGTPGPGDVGRHSVSLRVTDALGAEASQDFDVVVSGTGDGGASLSGGVSNQPGQSGSPGSADLTAAGLLDWVHWGRGSRTDVNRKASAAVSIGDYERLDPNGPRVNRMTDGRTAYRWSNGTPRGVESGTTTGLFFTADGYRIRVPADTSERTVSVYLGGWASSARFTASLSDGSAPSVVFDAGDRSQQRLIGLRQGRDADLQRGLERRYVEPGVRDTGRG